MPLPTVSPAGGFPSYFSRCTLPLVIYQHWPSNYAEFFARSPNLVNAMLHGMTTPGHKPVIDRNISIVINTVLKTPLQKFHSFLMQPFSVHAVSSFASFSSRAPASTKSAATAEGTHVRCFEKLLVCAFDHGWHPGMDSAGHTISSYYAPQLPKPSLPDEALLKDTLRIVFDKRPIVTSRQIVNVGELVQWCNSGGLKLAASSASPWRRVHCWDHSFGVDLLSDVGAARQADILVSHHGASQVNILFSKPRSAWLELRPYEFGTKYPFLPSMWGPPMTLQMAFRLFWFGVNIEDPADYMESPFEHYFTKTEEGKRFGNGPGALVQSRNLRLQPEVLQFMVDRIVEADRTRELYCRKYRTNTVLFTYMAKGQAPKPAVTLEGYKHGSPDGCVHFKQLDEHEHRRRHANSSGSLATAAAAPPPPSPAAVAAAKLTGR
jgi:hypothetical protein